MRIDPGVLEKLKHFPKADTERVAAVIRGLPLNPYFGDIQKLKGQENTWRRRSGSFRVFYKLYPNDKIISVFRVERRTSTTY